MPARGPADMPNRREIPQRRGVKRKVGHGAVVREALLEMTGDPFHPFVCGHGRSLKDDTREPLWRAMQDLWNGHELH